MGEWNGFDAEVMGSWPPECTPVIVCSAYGVVQHVAYQLVIDGDRAYWEDAIGYGDDIDIFSESQQITHWMPLPEPPCNE